jgi:hypothetical protein
MVTTHDRRNRESVSTAAIWWLFDHPRWLRVVVYGSLPVGVFALATLSGSPIMNALKLAGVQAGIIGGAALAALVLRRLF